MLQLSSGNKENIFKDIRIQNSESFYIAIMEWILEKEPS